MAPWRTRQNSDEKTDSDMSFLKAAVAY